MHSVTLSADSTVKHNKKWHKQWKFTDTEAKSTERNMWRWKDETQTVAEFAINKDGDVDMPFMEISADSLELVQKLLWRPAQQAKNGKKRKQWHAQAWTPIHLRDVPPFNRHRKDGTIALHRLLCPDFELTEHIDRNGLNNQLCNLREATPKQIANNISNNSNNTSGVNGISNSKQRQRFKVTYRDTDGNKMHKSFCYGARSLYGKEEAFERAVAFRLARDKENGCTNGHPIEKDSE